MNSGDTPADRRQALLAKRGQLHAQQAERMAQQRHAGNVARFERYLGAELARAGVAHEALWDRGVRPGPLARYPIGFASVRWDRVPDAVSVQGGSDALLKALLDAALHALAVAPASTVIVDWGIADSPRLALAAADVSTHGLALMRHGSDMWVYAADADWLVEVYHEGTVTHAARPGREEDAGDGWRTR
ncbi:hypothetical protein [Pseudoxanthomonas sp. 10H]|uniref:hypothetical protein n=1 Tax=Pseudoxanthomonas sp. 10H TaxID=3242729 RepID=UPI003557B2E9